MLDQWNRTDKSEINPYICGNLFATKDPIIYNRERTVSLVKDIRKAGQPHVKE